MTDIPKWRNYTASGTSESASEAAIEKMHKAVETIKWRRPADVDDVLILHIDRRTAFRYQCLGWAIPPFTRWLWRRARRLRKRRR